MRRVRGVLLIGVVAALAAAQAAAAAVDVRQMTDDTIASGGTLNCSANPLPNPTVEQSYYRRFHLPNYGVTGPFTVTGVTFGIQTANDGAGTGQPMTVRLEKIPAGPPLLLANLTLDDSEDFTIADSETGTLKTAVFSRTIDHPNTTDLVLELYEPDGVAQNNVLIFGSNQSAETKTAYWRAPSCSHSEPTPLNAPEFDIFDPGHMILFATGDEGPDVDPPNLGVKIPGGQTLAGALDEGLKARLSSGEPCNLDVTLLISRKLAHKLDIPRVVGTAHRLLAKAGTKTVVTDFTQKAKRALKDRHSLSLTVRAKATDDAANAKTVSKSVTL
jgi:hypothetical protein